MATGGDFLPVVDDAGSSASKALFAAIDRSATVRPIPADRKRILADGDAALLIIPASFEADLARGEAALDLRLKPNDLNAIAAQRVVGTAAGQISRAAQAARISADESDRLKPFVSPVARQAWYESSLQDAQALLATTPARMTVIRAVQTDTGYDPISHASTGQLITWVLIPMIGVGALFAYERETGTLRRLRTTPTSRAILLLGVAGGQLATALVQMTLLAGFGARVPFMVAATVTSTIVAVDGTRQFSGLGFTPDYATEVMHLFMGICYLLPLAGAYIADRFWGRYKTILYLSLFYCAGHATLAIFEKYEWGLYAGLGLIALVLVYDFIFCIKSGSADI